MVSPIVQTSTARGEAMPGVNSQSPFLFAETINDQSPEEIQDITARYHIVENLQKLASELGLNYGKYHYAFTMTIPGQEGEGSMQAEVWCEVYKPVTNMGTVIVKTDKTQPTTDFSSNESTKLSGIVRSYTTWTTYQLNVSVLGQSRSQIPEFEYIKLEEVLNNSKPSAGLNSSSLPVKMLYRQKDMSDQQYHDMLNKIVAIDTQNKRPMMTNDRLEKFEEFRRALAGEFIYQKEQGSYAVNDDKVTSAEDKKKYSDLIADHNNKVVEGIKNIQLNSTNDPMMKRYLDVDPKDLEDPTKFMESESSKAAMATEGQIDAKSSGKTTAKTGKKPKRKGKVEPDDGYVPNKRF